MKTEKIDIKIDIEVAKNFVGRIRNELTPTEDALMTSIMDTGLIRMRNGIIIRSPGKKGERLKIMMSSSGK